MESNQKESGTGVGHHNHAAMDHEAQPDSSVSMEAMHDHTAHQHSPPVEPAIVTGLPVSKPKVDTDPHARHTVAATPDAMAEMDHAAHESHGAHDEHTGHGSPDDMLRRLIVSLVITIPIVLFSPIGHGIGFRLDPPFGLSMAWFGLILSTVVVWWGGWPFISSAWRALRHGELNMMTLIALGILVSY